MDIVARELRIRHAMLVVNAAWFDMGMPAELFSADECRHGIHGGGNRDLVDAASSSRSGRYDARTGFRIPGTGNGTDFKLLTTEGRFGFGWQAQDLNPWGVCGNAALPMPGVVRNWRNIWYALLLTWSARWRVFRSIACGLAGSSCHDPASRCRGLLPVGAVDRRGP